MWSPCNQFIVISFEFTKSVALPDSATLQRIQSPGFSQKFASLRPEALAFSPDGRMLPAFVHGNSGARRAVVSWDLQTGGVASAIELRGSPDLIVVNAQITYSTNGKKVAILSRYMSSTIISIHDLVSGVSTSNIIYGARMDVDLELRNLYVYGFTSGAPTEVETFSFPDNPIQVLVFKPGHQYHIIETEFHPAPYRLAFIDTEDALLVWDARASKFLLHRSDIHFKPLMSFSPDARFFACRTTHEEIYLWKQSPTGYTLFEKLTPETQYLHPSFSPNGGSIIAFGASTIHLWHTKSFTTTSGILAPALRRTNGDFVLVFLPNRPLVVVVRKGDRTVMVLDLKSGAPRFAINASIEI